MTDEIVAALPSADTAKPKGTVQSVERAMHILNTVAHHPEGIGVRDIARAHNLKPPTVHALIKTLEVMTYLEHCPNSRKYRLGLGAIMLGFGAGTSWNTRLASTVRDLLDNLGDQLEETVFLYGMINGLVVCLDVINRTHLLSVRLDAGMFISLPHQVANGKVLLAYSEPTFLNQYLRHRAERKDYGSDYESTEDMVIEFERIRKVGYAEVIDVNGSGVYGIGMPVKGFFGRHDLSVGTAMPVNRADDNRREIMRHALKTTAKAMEARIQATADRM